MALDMKPSEKIDPEASSVRPDSEDQDHVAFKGISERKLMAKIDFHVIPWLCIMYILAFLDRVNIGNANTFDLSSPKALGGLNLLGDEYNTALVIFFVPYILCEIPSNLILKKLTPHVWLSLCMFLFGLVTICQGLVQSYGGLLATRFFLGLVESGMFPGCFYLIGMWYRRQDAQRRYSFFFNSTTLAGAFGGLLAAAIGTMDGVRGYRGWRWIFIIEGLDFPEQVKWLTEEEKEFVKHRLEVDQGKSAVERQITAKDVGNFFKDYKVYLGALAYFALIVPAYGYAYFSPTIIQTLHYSKIQTQLHSVPPWAAAFGLSMTLAWGSDKTRHRYLWTLFPMLLSVTGFSMLVAIHDNTNAKYGALFLACAGTYSAMPIIIAWFNQNLGGHHRRSVGSAWQIAFGNIGGIISVFIFLKKDAPKYTLGYSVSLAFVVFGMICCCAYLVACWSQNRKREKTPTPVALSEHEKVELGDLSPDYRYQL